MRLGYNRLKINGIPKLINSMTARVLIIVVMMYSLLITGSAISDEVSFETKQLILGGEKYSIEIARSAEQRNRGLMFRDQMEQRDGMLFIYPRSGYHRIWMKNTLITLTVIWIDENSQIIDIKILPPCVQSPCPSYGVSKPSKYVLELSDGNHHLESGQKINGLVQFE